MTDAEARKLLLAEIADRRGGAAAHRLRHATVDQLAAALGSMKATPARQATISKSWDSAFAKRGVETKAETKPGSWDRAFARLGVATDRSDCRTFQEGIAPPRAASRGDRPRGLTAHCSTSTSCLTFYRVRLAFLSLGHERIGARFPYCPRAIQSSAAFFNKSMKRGAR
jgi:hypothetical protein